MRSSLSRYIMLAKRWAWVVILGIVICSSTTFIVTKLMRPTYQATALLMFGIVSPNSSANDNAIATLTVIPTYVNLVTSPKVLDPVANAHGLTDKQLAGMVTVKQQSATEIIELDVKNSDPHLAQQLANEIAQSFVQFTSSQLSTGAQFNVIQAQEPTTPAQPQPGQDAIIAGLAGLGLSIALIIFFEWIDDRLANPEEVQSLLGTDVLTVIPALSQKQRSKNAEETPELAEGCRILCASMNMAQAAHPFKMVMVTSALAGEGKSTVAANIASFLAMSGKRVLLVDADLRHPVLDQHFQLDNRKGLSNAFLEMWAQVQIEMEGQPTEIPSLRVLTAGILPSNPSELLQSHLAHQLFNYLRNSQHFDYIIFDTPPILPVADAQILASYIQAAVLVADASKTPRKMLVRAKQVLSRAGTRILGVAINKSQWPEYGEIQDYLGNSIQQQKPRADIAISMPPNMPPSPNNRIEAGNPMLRPSPNR